MTRDSLKQKTGFELIMAVIAVFLVFGTAMNVYAAIPTVERNALIDLYNSTDGANWINDTGWNGAAGTECTSWYGVTCSGDTVTKIKLPSNDLSGTIPASIGNLTGLEELDLSGNQLTGSIPSEVGSLTDLKTLDLSGNQLSGSIPSVVGSLTALETLDLSGNQLSGSIPTQMGSLGSLQNLDLSDNQLENSVPPQMGELANLQTLDISGNQLAGAVPVQMGNLVGLTFGGSDFRYNALYTEDDGLRSFLNDRQIGGNWENTQTVQPLDMTAVTSVDASPTTELTSVPLIWTAVNNTGVTGHYEVYYSLTSGDESPVLYGTKPDISDENITVSGLEPCKTYYFRLQAVTPPHPDNSGTVRSVATPDLPAATLCIPLAEKQALTDLYNSTDGANWMNKTGWLTGPGTENGWHGVTLENNQVTEVELPGSNLVGTIPESVEDLTELRTLNLSENQLSGGIPAQIGNLASLTELNLSENQVSESIPSELGSIATLTILDLSDNQLTGSIPPELGSLDNLETLSLARNSLSGSIPWQIGNLDSILSIDFSGNQLSGEIPVQIINITTLTDGSSDFRWNALYTKDASLRILINSKQKYGDWQSTQTVAPGNLTADEPTTTSVSLSWDAIEYSDDAGGYEIEYSETFGGLYTLFGTTENKFLESISIEGLMPETTYYFRIRTVTSSHVNNPNTVYSGYTEISATTADVSPPYINQITPSHGPASGGTTITIKGTNFVNGATVYSDRLDFYLSIISISSTAITCISPVYETNTMDVLELVVTNPDGQSDTTFYTYDPLPTITQIGPSHGSESGGSEITIKGSNFTEGAEVIFGDKIATEVIFFSSSEIGCVSPPMDAPTTIDITVTNPDGQSATCTACFTYTPPLAAKIDSPPSHTVITEGEFINFQGSITGENAPFTHSWDFDYGAVNSVSEDPGNIAFNKKGSYTVTFTVTDAQDNTASDSLIVTVLSESPSEAAIITEHETICKGDSANLIFILPKYASPFDVEYTDGTLDEDGNPKPYPLTGISNGHAISVAPTSITTYSLISVIGANGQKDLPSSSVTISPDVSGIWGSLKVGPGETKKYSVRETPDASYQWTVTGGTIISGQGDAGERTTFNDEEVNQIRVQWGYNGGKISVTETNAAGCQHTGSLFVSPYFTPEIGRDFAQFQGQATIDGQPPQAETWIAAFDQEGNCVGTDKLMIIGDTAYISLYIYGDDPETASRDGMRENEPFTLQIKSETGFLEHGLSFTWQPTGGAPLPGYDNTYLCNFESENRVKRDSQITRNAPRGSPFPIPSLTLEAGRFLGQATVNGEPAEEGDWIAALDENGRCVGARDLIIRNGIAHIGLMIYGLFADNNTFTLRLYDASAVNEGSENPYLDIDCATPCPFTWQDVGGDNIPEYSNSFEVYNFSSPMDLSEILLNKGWNLISFDVESRSTSASDVLSTLTGENDPSRCLYMRTFANDPSSGQYGVLLFDPYGPPSMNTLEIEKGYGYWIKTCQDVKLELMGRRIDPDYRPELNPGLNLVMYNGPETGQSPEAYFFDHINAGELEYAIGFDKDGYKSYDPYGLEWLNDLEVMKRGSGYQVKKKGQEPEPEAPCDLHPHPSIFGTLKGEVRLEGELAEEGDWVLAFDSEGNCAGAERIKTDEAYVELVIYSDDGSSSEDEGIGSDDYFTLKLYKASGDGGRYITYPRIFSGWSGNNGLPLRETTDVYDFVECGNLILVAGGGKDTQDPLYASTQYLSDMVYSRFLIRGFRDEEIRYFNPEPFHDIDGDGTSDPVLIDDTPTVAELRQAIETWAAQQESTGPLYLVMINHGGIGTFEVSTGQVITADELDESLTSFQNATGRDVVVIMEACKSGSFADDLARPGSDRMVITCTNEKDAYLGRNGYLSFTNFLMGELYLGKTFAESFNTAKAQLASCGTPYSRMAPQFAESSLSGKQLGGNFAIAGPSPEFLNPPENRTIEAGTTEEFSISVSSYGENNEVWAVVKPPNYEPPPMVEDLETPKVTLPTFDLTDEDGDSVFTGTYGDFTDEGEYSIIFYARNPDGLVSISQPTMITVTTCGTDFNHNTQTDIGDAILGLKALAGLATPDICGGDISGDGKVGLAEIISVLKEIAGLK